MNIPTSRIQPVSNCHPGYVAHNREHRARKLPTINIHTKHSETRMAQRAISERDVEALLAWGDLHHERGAEIYLGTKETADILAAEGLSRQEADRIRGKYLVIKDHSILTVAHKYH